MIWGKIKLPCLRSTWVYCREKGKQNFILKFEPNRIYGFWEIAVERFLEFYCLCQYSDKINEENWQNMHINIIFWQMSSDYEQKGFKTNVPKRGWGSQFYFFLFSHAKQISKVDSPELELPFTPFLSTPKSTSFLLSYVFQLLKVFFLM